MGRNGQQTFEGMNDAYIRHQLAGNLSAFRSLLEGLDKDEYLWKPQPEKWCLLEIVCHLHDEEREDFRARTRHVLDHPHLPMPPIDPVGWVVERKYLEQDYAQMLQRFLEERSASITWLESLESPAWDNVYNHPKLGSMSAKLFLSNWLAHDYLHLRQILRTKFGYLKQLSGETLDYAGDW